MDEQNPTRLQGAAPPGTTPAETPPRLEGSGQVNELVELVVPVPVIVIVSTLQTSTKSIFKNSLYRKSDEHQSKAWFCK